jgi:hypothetical protein
MSNDQLTRLIMICEGTQKAVDELKEIVCGNGNPAKGLVIRIDRLEQSAAIVRKVFWIAIGAIVTPASIGSLIWYLISQHHPY